MSTARIYKVNGWTIEFHKNIHMYSHSLKLTSETKTYPVPCEDTPAGFLGIWPYELQENVTDSTYKEIIEILRAWASQLNFHYQLYTSQNDYETNVSQYPWPHN